MPAYRTRDTRPLADALEASTYAHSRANSPFEPDLRTLTLTPPSPTTSSSSAGDATYRPTPPPQAPKPRRRRGAADDNVPRPKKGDASYVKRPENAFILFRRACCEERNAQEAQLVGPAPKRQRQADLSKAISQQWKDLTPDEKEVWEARARERKAEHAALHPDYVYRPQRTKKGKARQQGDDITFTVPAPAPASVQQDSRTPTPPPATQTVVIPNLFMPTPTQAPAQGGEIEPDWSFPAFVADDAAPQFTKPEGWRPEVHNTQSSPVYEHAYAAEPAFQPEPAFAYPVDANGLFNPGASFSMSSSGAPSPRTGPYTPNMVSRPLDGEAPMPLDIHSGANMWTAASLQSQPWDQQANAWAWSAGAGTMFDDHFELSMIPPVALDVPKFELDQQSKYDSSAVDPAMLHAPSSYGQDEQQHQWTEGNTWGYGYEGYDSGLAA